MEETRKTQEPCLFCDHEAIKKDILFPGRNFLIKIGIQIITPGHIMIIPKKHYRCLGDLSPELQEELEKLKEQTRKIVRQQFSEPFWVEYGPGRQSIPHAHIHCLPLRGEGYALGSFIREIEPQLILEEGSWEKVREIRKQGLSYIYIEEKGKKCLFPFEASTRGNGHFHYRDFFSRIKGAPGLADWKTAGKQEKKDDERKRERTKARLAEAFRSLAI